MAIRVQTGKFILRLATQILAFIAAGTISALTLSATIV